MPSLLPSSMVAGVWPDPPLSAPQRYLGRPRAVRSSSRMQPRRTLSTPDLADKKRFRMYASASNTALNAYLSTGQYNSSSRLHVSLAKTPVRKLRGAGSSVTIAEPEALTPALEGADGLHLSATNSVRPRSAPQHRERDWLGGRALSIELLHKYAPTHII